MNRYLDMFSSERSPVHIYSQDSLQVAQRMPQPTLDLFRLSCCHPNNATLSPANGAERPQEGWRRVLLKYCGRLIRADEVLNALLNKWAIHDHCCVTRIGR